MPDVLDDAAVRAELADLPGWSGDRAGITRSVKAPTFLDGIQLVSEVAAVAEEMNHHPDIDIRWTRVTFRLSTHSAGGVTGYDIELARRIDGVAAKHAAG